MAASPPAERYLALDSLRGICALAVALYHFRTQGHIFGSGFVSHAFLFVDFFFVLSGFVIAGAYGRRLAGGMPVHTFMLIRLGRIYPLHLAVLLAFVIAEVGFAYVIPGFSDRAPFSGSFSIPALAYSLLLIQIFAGPAEQNWNLPSWSIAAEIWTYLAFAVTARRMPRLILAVSALTAIAAPITLLIWPGHLVVVHNGAFARCLYGFSLGILANAAITGRYGRALASSWTAGVWTAAELIALGAVAVFVSEVGAQPLSLLAPPLFLIVVLIFAHQRGRVSRLLTTPFPLLLGALSYSIYMLHDFIVFRIMNLLSLAERGCTGGCGLIAVHGPDKTVRGVVFGDAASIFMLVTVCAAAWCTHRWIELPAMRWSRRKVLGSPHRGPEHGEETANEAAAF